MKEHVSKLLGSERIGWVMRDTPDAELSLRPHGPLHYLGYNLQQLETADVAIFAYSWEEDRSCVIEEEAARLFGIDVIYLGSLSDNGD